MIANLDRLAAAHRAAGRDALATLVQEEADLRREDAPDFLPIGESLIDYADET